jgi:hypothetical protein
MENKLHLTTKEFGLLEIALGDKIYDLRNKFEENIRYVHAAEAYEELYAKITAWSDSLPEGFYTLSPVQ